MPLSLTERDRIIEKALMTPERDTQLRLDAIAPSPDIHTSFREGYRFGMLQNLESTIPFIVAAVRQQMLFDIFLEMIDKLGDEVDVILETSHDVTDGKHKQLWREGIDLPILKSICDDFRKLLVCDGFTGIVVLSRNEPQKVQFDENKLIVIHAQETLTLFRSILRRNRILHKPFLQFICEGPHRHHMLDGAPDTFEALRRELQAEER